MIFYFYKNNVNIEDLKKDSNLVVEDISFSEEIKLHYFENTITLLPDDECEFVTQMETLKKCEVASLDDIVVLKYLFETYDVPFYDENYKDYVSYINKDKEPNIYDMALTNYIVDSMCHYNIVNNDNALRNMMINKEVLMSIDRLRKRRMKRELLISKIKLFFYKFIYKIKFW